MQDVDADLPILHRGPSRQFFGNRCVHHQSRDLIQNTVVQQPLDSGHLAWGLWTVIHREPVTVLTIQAR